MMNSRRWLLPFGLCLTLLAAGCTAPTPTSTPAAPEPTATPEPSPEIIALREAQRWLEAYIGRPLSDLDVAYGAEEWPDAGLGCPEPGRTYSQVTTPGFRFDITVDGVLYQVHTNVNASQVVLCPSAATGELPGRPEEMASEAARMALREALGPELAQLPPPLTVEQATWEDTALGCPADAQTAATGEVAGFRFQFLILNQLHDVRASGDGSAAVRCSTLASETEWNTAFESFESQPLGLDILYPAGWWAAARENVGEVTFHPGNDLPTLGMTIRRSRGHPGTVDDCLSSLESELFAGDRTASAAGPVQTVSGSGRSGRYYHQLGGGYVIERVTCYPQGFQIRQWAPAEEWEKWEEPFLRILDSLALIPPA